MTLAMVVLGVIAAVGWGLAVYWYLLSLRFHRQNHGLVELFLRERHVTSCLRQWVENTFGVKPIIVTLPCEGGGRVLVAHPSLKKQVAKITAEYAIRQAKGETL